MGSYSLNCWTKPESKRDQSVNQKCWYCGLKHYLEPSLGLMQNLLCWTILNASLESLDIMRIKIHKVKNCMLSTYLKLRQYFCIRKPNTIAALLEIPAFPCTRAFPPAEKQLSKKFFTFWKCWMMFSVTESLTLTTKYLKKGNGKRLEYCKE